MDHDKQAADQIKARGRDLLAEAEKLEETLQAAMPGIKSAFAGYQTASRQYAFAHGRGPERDALNALAHRTGGRMILFAKRSEVAAEQSATELELYHINDAIFWTSITIGVGKCAEMILGMISWTGKLKAAVDAAKLDIDAVKALQPVAAGALTAVGQGDKKDLSAGNIVQGVAQIGAYTLRLKTSTELLGKNLWEALSLVRRARSAKDLGAAASTAMQALKTVVELMKAIVQLTENGIDQFGKTVPSTVQPALGRLSAFMGVVRDLIDAARAFYAAYETNEEMRKNVEKIESEMERSNAFTGDANAALAKLSALPPLTGLETEDIDDLAVSTLTYNEARLLTDKARQEAKRIEDDARAAKTFADAQRLALRTALAPMKAPLSRTDAFVMRLRAALGHGHGLGPVNAASSAERQVDDHLRLHLARLTAITSQLHVLEAGAQ